MAQTQPARRSALGETTANLARMVVPPIGIASAVGLGVAGIALDGAGLGAAGALAGSVGACAAWWRARTVEGRLRTERARNRENHRRLQLQIEDVRRRRQAVERGLESAAGLLHVPDHVPDVMPAARPVDAPAISMELPALSAPVLVMMDAAAERVAR